jgi:putative membrane protein
MRTRIALILFTLALTPACKKDEKKEEPAAAAKTPAPAEPTPAPSEPPAAKAAALNDAQIAAIVVAANQVDVDAGNLALKKSQNAQVKELAQRMVTDHTAVNKAAGDLVGKLGVTPEETDASKGLTTGGADKRAELDKLDGAAFDKAYVDNEVAYHEAVIGVLDAQLIPSAANAELKKTLVDVRPAFQAHLEHAKQVQTALAGGAPADHGAHK